MALGNYVMLGRSGLRVSPLCLGTMTFGTEWGFGSDESEACAVFDAYVAAGGNFVDTADIYVFGKSEEMVGKFVRERKLRDQLVIATKFTMNQQRGNPNTGGNGRKNIYRALEGSLRRLATDYVDVYWLHAWDRTTPVEEVLGTLNSLVQAGKIRYYGFSNVPGWYLGRAEALAEKEGKERPIALQLEYSLVERGIELELIPAAQEFGIGIAPWSPLAGGFLTGKYRKGEQVSQGRLKLPPPRPSFQVFTERNWKILDSLLGVARESGKTPAAVALNWAATQPGITSTIIGTRTLEQLNANLTALDFSIAAELRARLDEASALEMPQPYRFFDKIFEKDVNGGVPVRHWQAAAHA